MASPGRWSDQLVCNFIKLYRERPCLWQSDNPNYKCKPKRQEALRSLVQQMGIDGFDVNSCKLKIKNLRSHYCQELKKIRYASECGGAEYRPSLVWFPLLHQFLRRYVHQSPDTYEGIFAYNAMKADQEETESRHEEEEEEEEEESFDLNDFNQDAIPDIIIKQEEAEEDPIPTNGHIPNSRKRQLSYHRRIKKGRSPYVYSMEQPETEFDIFCRSVALQLNNMPLENALRLQHNIQNMVTEERLNCLQNQQNKNQRSDC
ncbi:uncharacterized protein LOC143913198 [Arctopsyche grandis]|uniref:uncharacterized protein LOC143913198 n=1 Tax=Arctopsyche grandis TaxID=121162 RepID=UPI00406D82B0